MGNCTFREELFGTDPQLPCTKVIVNEGQAILMAGGTRTWCTHPFRQSPEDQTSYGNVN